MNSNNDAQDEIISVRQELLESLKRSNQIFRRNSYLEALGVPLFIIFYILFAVASSASVGVWFVLIVNLVFLPCSWGRSVKKSFSFLRWSGSLFHEMETPGQEFQILGSIISYINKMYYSVLAPTFQIQNTPDVKPAELLNKARHQKLVIFISWVVVTFAFSLLLITISPERMAQLGYSWDFTVWLFVAVSVFLIAELVNQALWAKSLQRLVFYYDALDSWGRELERNMSGPSMDDDGGF